MARGDALHLGSVVVLLGAFPALAGASLDVSRGEVVLVKGANGAGKTTLLRTCAGLVAAASGEVEVLGHDLTGNRLISGRREMRREIGFLGQAAGLYDDLSVDANVRFALRAAGVCRAAAASATSSAVTRLGLDGRLAATAVGRLSTGQRRRTALAVLAARSPALWLLDEPHAGLDAEGRDLLDGLVRDAVAGGATVVLASHELDRATAIAHRTVTVAGGIVLAEHPGAEPSVGGHPHQCPPAVEHPPSGAAPVADAPPPSGAMARDAARVVRTFGHVA